MAGRVPAPPWLQVDGLLAQFGRRRAEDVQRYVDHVRAGVGLPGVWEQLKGQVYLGCDEFVARMQRKAVAAAQALEVPRMQRRAPAGPLTHYVALGVPRPDAMARAYAT